MSRVRADNLPLQLELLGAGGSAAPPAVHAVLRDVGRLAAALDQQNRPTAPIHVRERQAVQLILLLPPASDFRLRWGEHPLRVVTTHDAAV